MESNNTVCELCMNATSPLYQLTLTLSAKGWSTIDRTLWMCADCQHKLAFEKNFLYTELFIN